MIPEHWTSDICDGLEDAKIIVLWERYTLEGAITLSHLHDQKDEYRDGYTNNEDN